MNKVIVKAFFVVLAVWTASTAYADYSSHANAKAFINLMHKEHGFEKDYVRSILAKAEKQQSILDAISRPAEKTKKWFDYRNIFIQESRIAQGVQFWNENKETLARAEKEFGVPAEIIVAIIGVETRYGRHAGKHRVIDALTTLGFDYPKRGKFFTGQLEAYFLMVREQKQDPLSLKGSYAGAMGYGQFIPTSYRAYAVDFDADDIVNIWTNPVDAIGSVANYFRAHRWVDGAPVMERARIKENYDESLVNGKHKPKLTLDQLVAKGFTPVNDKADMKAEAVPLMYEGESGTEFWLGYDNFYVITRYNRSRLYARAVWELSEAIKIRYNTES